MKTTSELLNTGLATEGSKLIVKKIYDTLLRERDKKRLPQEIIAINVGPGGCPGSSVDFNNIVKDSITIQKIAEGAEFPLEADAYAEFNVKPVKKGCALSITAEMQEDGKWDLLQASIKSVAMRLADENDTDMVSSGLTNATNTVSGGANITVANITRAMQYLEDEDYVPSDMIVGNEVANDMRNIDTFVEADKFGSREALQSGFIGTLFGMKVWRAGTTALNTLHAYVIDREYALIKVTKRPITIKNFDDVKRDLSGAVVSTRYLYRQLFADAMCKIITT